MFNSKSRALAQQGDVGGKRSAELVSDACFERKAGVWEANSTCHLPEAPLTSAWQGICTTELCA
jgi:hypothetical protein